MAEVLLIRNFGLVFLPLASLRICCSCLFCLVVKGKHDFFQLLFAVEKFKSLSVILLLWCRNGRPWICVAVLCSCAGVKAWSKIPGVDFHILLILWLNFMWLCPQWQQVVLLKVQHGPGGLLMIKHSPMQCILLLTQLVRIQRKSQRWSSVVCCQQQLLLGTPL